MENDLTLAIHKSLKDYNAIHDPVFFTIRNLFIYTLVTLKFLYHFGIRSGACRKFISPVIYQVLKHKRLNTFSGKMTWITN